MMDLDIQNMKILSVDDDSLNLQVIEAYAETLNVQVVSFSNPYAALEEAHRQSFDLVITDYMMPGIDGVTLVKQLRAEKVDVPIIMLTALNDHPDLHVEALKAGCNDFLLKPIEPAIFRARLINLLKLQKTHQLIAQKTDLLKLQIAEKDQELVATQTLLSVHDRLTSLGQLAAGISHEINNPINFIRTNFAVLTENFNDLGNSLQAARSGLKELACDLHTEDPETAEQLQNILQPLESDNIDFILQDTPDLFSETEVGFQRVSGIIRNMRDFSRTDDISGRTMANINKELENSLILSRNEYKYHATVTTELGNIPEIYCFPGQLNQVFLNLIVNSAQAIAQQEREDKGLIQLRTYQQGDNVICEIQDDGPGIPADIRSRIFDPFFTTKPPGKGTGLGLSISYNIIVNQHQGVLSVECPDSGGTLFRIRLPLESRKGDRL